MTIDMPIRECLYPATDHREMWALGDYPAMAEQVMAPLGPVLVSASGVRPGYRVLDVAAGSGNVSLHAALVGAHVIASDLTPDLLRRAQARAAAEGLEIGWREANAEALPFGTNGFDTVLSAIGAMFAPRHQRTADELSRVCRKRGTIGTISWTPDGFYGRMLSAIRPHRPDLPVGAPYEVWWGNEDYLSYLFRDHVGQMRTRRSTLKVHRFDSPEACLGYFKSHYGPMINAYRNIADDAGLVAALDDELLALCDEYLEDGVMQWEYLIMVARKA